MMYDRMIMSAFASAPLQGISLFEELAANPDDEAAVETFFQNLSMKTWERNACAALLQLHMNGIFFPVDYPAFSRIADALREKTAEAILASIPEDAAGILRQLRETKDATDDQITLMHDAKWNNDDTSAFLYAYTLGLFLPVHHPLFGVIGEMLHAKARTAL